MNLTGETEEKVTEGFLSNIGRAVVNLYGPFSYEKTEANFFYTSTLDLAFEAFENNEADATELAEALLIDYANLEPHCDQERNAHRQEIQTLVWEGLFSLHT